MTRVSWLAAASAASVLTLTGCSGLSPNSAATIGDTRITMSELDQFATGFCVFQKANGQPPSNAEIRTQALTIMVLSRLAAQEGTAPVDESVINQAVTSVEPALSELSEEDKEAFLDEVRASVAADQKASGQAVADNGGQVPDDLQLAQAEVFAQWAEDAG
ncbi:MAG: hypothetical protein HZY75_04750 [Nocardioidaceae bacterium]|nr:MAG: hypothetical protein HZY75_04750 [Nocardioidaceae bacterium]